MTSHCLINAAWRAAVSRERGILPWRHGEGGAAGRQAFTLLEMMLVLFITAMLVTTVFGIVNGVTQLTNGITVEQQRQARTHAFVQMCSRSFRELPATALVRLHTRQAGGRYLTQLALADAPPLFAVSAGTVTVLETEELPGGYLQMALRSLTDEQATAWERGDNNAGVRVPLLQDLSMLEWRVLNVKSRQWQSVWNHGMPLFRLRDRVQGGGGVGPEGPQSGGRGPDLGPPVPDTGGLPVEPQGSTLRPTMVELRFAQGNEAPQRWVFWVPSVKYSTR